MTSFGILLVDKPSGPTSHTVVNLVRRGTGIRKVGHAGTLDPRASGLLVLCLGAATRLSEYLSSGDKTYQAVVRFGIATDTFDADGEVLVSGGQIPTADDIDNILPSFRGQQSQTPPPFSAVKIGGRKAYEMARKGESPELAPRLIEIKVLDVLSFEPPDLSLLVTCSAGTYIRTLADDLGKALGGAAHLLALRRTQAGPFRLEQAVGLAQLRAEFDEGPVDADGAPAWARHVRPAAEALPGLPNVQLTGAEVEAVQNGHAIPAPSGSQGSAKALDGQGTLIAILEATDDGLGWHPQKVFPV